MNELHQYFNDLKLKFSLPEYFELKWMPDPESKYKGKVTDTTVYIFDDDLEEARRTLLHEIIDLYITKLSLALNDPQVVKNETEAYYLKEAVVERILSFIFENNDEELRQRAELGESALKGLKKIADADDDESLLKLKEVLKRL